jgi:hypothetical protein
MVLLVVKTKEKEPNCWRFNCDGPPKVETVAQIRVLANFRNYKRHCILHEYTKADRADSMRNGLISWQNKRK